MSSSSSEKDARICSSESPLRRVIMSDGEEIENDSGAKNRKAETKIKNVGNVNTFSVYKNKKCNLIIRLVNSLQPMSRFRVMHSFISSIVKVFLSHFRFS